MFALLRPVDGLHEYVVPPEAPKLVVFPEHIVTSEPAFATGCATTVTVTAEVDVQVPVVPVTV
jgi:hypothetical protein